MQKSIWVAVGLVLLAACASRDAAETAIKDAEKVITDVHAHALRYAPDEFKQVMDEYRLARKHLAGERFGEAVRSAEEAATLARRVGRSATASKTQLQQSWTAISDSVTTMLKAIDDRIAALSGAASLPQGLTRETVSGAKAAAAEISDGLAQAARSAEDGQLRDAVHAATRLKARADEIMNSLKISEAPRA